MKNILKRIWKELTAKEEIKVVSLYLFIAKSKKGNDTPTVVYYAVNKEDIYPFASKNELSGHIKEDVYSIERAEQIALLSTFIHPSK